MLRRRLLLIGCACATTTLALTWTGRASRGDTLKLKDGTSLSGKVMDAGPTYWFKDADGQTRQVPKDDVQQWVHGDADAAPAAAVGRGQAASLPGSGSFQAVKAKADRVDTPIQAVALWQTFIDNHPPAADLTAAKAELAHWNELVTGNAEKINGKWVGGDDRNKLLAQVRDLIKQADKDLESHQILDGIHELEQAQKLYPNDFDVNFLLGMIRLSQGAETHNNAKMDLGIRSMEVAIKLRPTCAEALSDLAIAYVVKGRTTQAIDMAYRAVKLKDTKGTTQNLIFTIGMAPPGIRNNAKYKPIIEDATTLANANGVGNAHEYVFLRPPETDPQRERKEDENGKHDDSEGGPAGIIGNGTGELVSADGYILTNRHVAKEGDYLMVRTSDGTMKVADRVVIDDEQDMAIIKIKTDAPLPYLRLAAYDHPPTGADVAVFGFPIVLLAQQGSSLNTPVKMTRGIITAWDGTQKNWDVTVDAQVNPGNSGGPMVDHFGNMLALTTAKSTAGNFEGSASIASYGLGQSTGRIRRFLAKQAAKLTGLKMEPGLTDKVLTNEDLATKLTPITVCIFICRGAPPTDGMSMVAARSSNKSAASPAKPPAGKRPSTPALP